ncbi:unnamed protein product [Cercospora beticola]|nr:unnamed protein product [Cercospora beticola]
MSRLLLYPSILLAILFLYICTRARRTPAPTAGPTAPPLRSYRSLRCFSTRL